MPDLNLWEGGRPLTLDDCGECRTQTCPAPHRMAAHRRRSPYLLGGAFDPACDVVRHDCYEALEAGDIVWLALIPEDSLFESVRGLVEVPDATNVITFNIIANLINLDDCVLGAAVTLPGSYAGQSSATQHAIFSPLTADVYTDPYAAGPVRTGIVVGLELLTLPAGGALAFLGRINLAVYARDFQVATIADCRLNGPCVINVPALPPT